MMPNGRVVLANDSRLLREMLKRVINKVPGLHVVEEIGDLARLMPAIRRTDPTWAVVSLSADGSMPEVTNTALQEHPMHILGLKADWSRAKVKSLSYHEKDLGHLSLGDLIDILTSDHVEELIQAQASRKEPKGR